MNQLLGICIVAFGMISGLSWCLGWANSRDLVFYKLINTAQLWDGIDHLVTITRWLGTKWAFMVYLGFVLVWRFPLGSTLIMAGLITTGVEVGIKLLIKRPRPFSVINDAVLRQNPIPQDSSFPSGDATRIWFIFVTLVIGISPSIAIQIIVGLSALFVSYGRVRLGVHYPLDVWAGSCLGFGLGLVWTALMT
jgi:membrane-associated phospholipid phosphatase